MNAFAWGVLGSVAGVVAAAATIVFGLFPLLQKRKEIPKVPTEVTDAPSPAGDGAQATLPSDNATFIGRRKEVRSERFSCAQQNRR